MSPPEPMPYRYSEADFDGSHAAPLLIVGETAKPYLIENQDRLAHNFEQLAHSELDSFVKPSVINFVIHSITSRMYQREGLNGISYIHRLNKEPVIPSKLLSADEVEQACEDAKHGHGSVLQNEIARRAFAMSSVELANLTIIGEARKNLEAPMWREVSQLVHMNAFPEPSQVYGEQVLGFDRDIRDSAHIGAMRIGMKRTLGKTDYGAHVKARTTAIINMSPSTGIDGETVALFRETAQQGKSISELPEFKRMVEWLVKSELPHGLVLARNETVYDVQPHVHKG